MKIIDNKYSVFYRQWKDYFDFLEIDVILPEVVFRGVGLSTRLKNEAFCDGDQTSFLLSLETRVSSEYSSNAKAIRCVILGFGFEVVRRTGY